MKNRTWNARSAQRATVVGYDTVPPPPAISQAQQEELDRLKFEADQARAEAAKIKAALEDVKKEMPSAEQRARWAELESQAAKAEEDRALKAGEFETLKAQLTTRYEREIEGHKQATANALARAEGLERDIEDEMVAREFAAASNLFGPSGKTVWFPDVAQAYFRRNVEVEKTEQNGRTVRRVIVKTANGTTVLDKNGQPMAFAKAMEELIDSHPQREAILRGSGKVGAGSLGGSHGTSGDIDVTRLKQKDFEDPKVRDAVRNKLSSSGGLQIGPGFDRFQRNKR